MRVVIADDSLLTRAGIASLLRDVGFAVVGVAASADELLRLVDALRPDIAIVDIRMPPDYDDEGVQAAHEIRARHPGTGIVILSQHVDLRTATRVLAERPEGLGYLLKERVTDVEEFAATLRRVAAGGMAMDPEVVSRLLVGPTEENRLSALTPREVEVLRLVAEGRSNRGIAERLVLTERSVKKHVTSIFAKFSLPADEEDNRRILAVLEYLAPDLRTPR